MVTLPVKASFHAGIASACQALLGGAETIFMLAREEPVLEIINELQAAPGGFSRLGI